MEKHHLTSRKRSIDAGFNKMPILKAEIVPFKINGLHELARGLQQAYQ
ncbi:hypothetical protein [Massilia sp. Mn16-1_5]|nr:hypothetical protein [Massilia sp. Mn16-1_5]